MARQQMGNCCQADVIYELRQDTLPKKRVRRVEFAVSSASQGMDETMKQAGFKAFAKSADYMHQTDGLTFWVRADQTFHLLTPEPKPAKKSKRAPRTLKSA